MNSVRIPSIPTTSAGKIVHNAAMYTQDWAPRPGPAGLHNRSNTEALLKRSRSVLATHRRGYIVYVVKGAGAMSLLRAGQPAPAGPAHSGAAAGLPGPAVPAPG